jgi:hypothetical protein
VGSPEGQKHVSGHTMPPCLQQVKLGKKNLHAPSCINLPRIPPFLRSPSSQRSRRGVLVGSLSFRNPASNNERELSYAGQIQNHPRPEKLRLVTFETIGSVVENVNNPFAVTFKNQFALDSAFLAAGIYLRDVSHPDPERSAPPNPEKNFEVTADTLRTIGFDIPK